MMEVLQLVVVVFSILGGVFGIVKYFTSSLRDEIREDVKECKKAAADVDRRLDLHLENHS